MTAARRAPGRPAAGAVSARPASDALLTPDEVAAELRLAVDTLKRWRYLGRGPAHLKVGARVRYRRDAVDAFLAR